jgi:hypothetical protein
MFTMWFQVPSVLSEAADIWNGSFENGLDNWTQISSNGFPDADWQAAGIIWSFPPTIPPDGNAAAISMFSWVPVGTKHRTVLYQDVFLEVGYSHTLFVNIAEWVNTAVWWDDEPGLDLGDLHFRVDVINPVSNFWTVNPADIYGVIFATNFWTLPQSIYMPYSVDLSNYAGQTVRIRAAVAYKDIAGFFGSSFVAVDNFHIVSTLNPSTSLNTTATCSGDNLNITITAGDGPFNISTTNGTGSASGVSTGVTQLAGPNYFENVTVTETVWNNEIRNLGNFLCGPAPVLTILPGSADEGATGSFIVDIDPVFPADTIVYFTTTDGSAVAGMDYTITSVSPVIIPAGSASTTIDFAALPDSLIEGDETFTVTLIAAGGDYGSATISVDQADGTIFNKLPAISIDDVEVEELNTSRNFTITMDLPLAADTLIYFDINDVTATNGVDFIVNTLSPVTIPAGETSAAINFNVISDIVAEFNDGIHWYGTETFTVDITNATNPLITPSIIDSQGLGTIIDSSDHAVIELLRNTTVTEGNTGSFTIDMWPAAAEVTIELTINDVTASGGGTDYLITTPNPIIFPPSPESTTEFSTAIVEFTTTDDNIFEGTETFTLSINSATAPILPIIYDSSPVVGSIVDNESIPGISIDDVTAIEGDDSAFNISINPLATTDTSVTFTVNEDTATSPMDFTLNNTSPVIIPAETESVQVAFTTQDDDLDEGSDETFTVDITGATNPQFSPTVLDSQGMATITDNDTVGVLITELATPMETTEWDSAKSPEINKAGGTALFTVTLNSEPATDVTIGISSSDLSEGTVSTGSLTFTSSNWATPQTVTVTGVDDAVDDGDIPYTIHTTASSADPLYDAIDPEDVSVTNLDDETAGITLDVPANPLITDEGGGSASFTIVLDSEPTSNAVIALSSSDTGEGIVSPGSLTFTSVNWAVPLTVTVTGVNDSQDDGDAPYIVNTTLSSADPLYDVIDPADVSVTNLDDDTAGITLDVPANPLIIEEDGGTASFTMVLSSEPTADVVIALSSSDTSEGIVSPESLIFTIINWAAPQTVTVTGVDDAFDDGDVPFTITAAYSSSDPLYNVLDPANVNVTTLNDDSAGFTLSLPSNPLITEEAGGSTGFTMQLDSEPVADVLIALSSSDTSEGIISPDSLIFSSANWAVSQSVTVMGVDDAVDDGDIPYTIHTGSSSTDPLYGVIDPEDVNLINLDDDTAGFSLDVPADPMITTERGDSASFTVMLTSEPTSNVTITTSSSDTSEGWVSPASLTFTTYNWNITQVVTVTGVSDDIPDDEQIYYVVIGPAVSSDTVYDGFDAPDVRVINLNIASVPTMGSGFLAILVTLLGLMGLRARRRTLN